MSENGSFGDKIRGGVNPSDLSKAMLQGRDINIKQKPFGREAP